MPLWLLVACLPSTGIPMESGETATEPCGGTIYYPRSGFDTSEPVPAELDAAVFGAAPRPLQVHLSWSDDPSSTLALVWRTDADTLATRVQFGPDSAYGSEGSGASFTLAYGEEFGRVHEAHLCGLTPGTTYHYRVGGEGAWSEDQTFTTAPPPGAKGPIRFVVAGDSRDNQVVWGQILAASEKLAPDFYMFSGDAVDLGTNLDEWDAWYAAGEGYLNRRPVIQAHGNHEFQVQTYYGLVALPGNEQWFSLDVGPLHLVMLNDTVAGADDKELQAEWMAEDLAKATAPWKFAFHHIPAYSSCTNHGSNETLQKLWSPVEEAGGVAIDFAGHNHNYERSFPLLGGKAVGVDAGTTYIVSAGAGADLYDNEKKHAFTEVAVVAENYVAVEVDGGRVEAVAYDLAGNVLDTFVRER